MTRPRTFAMIRDEDVTGASGTGHVADGVQFADGTVVIRWIHEHASTVVWADIDDAIAVHGHDGRTRVVWDESEQAEAAVALDDFAALIDRGPTMIKLPPSVFSAMARERAEDLRATEQPTDGAG